MSRLIPKYVCVLSWLVAQLCMSPALGFTTRTSNALSHRETRPTCCFAAREEGEFLGGDSNDENDTPVGPTKSRMNDYVARFLGKKNEPEVPIETNENTTPFSSDDLSTATHLVAIPVDTCHELLIELESVQRAILYHCPVLVDACIPPSMTRLPLLYVKAPEEATAKATGTLAKMVRLLVQEFIIDARDEDSDEKEGEIDEETLNFDGTVPVTMTFQSLEIDGKNNNVLNTVGVSDDQGTKKIRRLVENLREQVEALGWQTALPLDPQSSGKFRPRVAFMELPKEFSDNIDHFKAESTEISDEDAKFLTSDQGGNGISPILWCQWWDDVFGRNIRLKEVGIFPRQNNILGMDAPTDLSYSMFYLPYETIPLPDGNPAMLRIEQKFQNYQDKRLEEQQLQLNEEESITTDAVPDDPQSMEEPDVLMTKTRARLEQIYIDSADIDEFGTVETPPAVDQTKSVDEVEPQGENIDIDWEKSTPEASPDDYMDDWMKARIKKAIESQESEKSRNPVKKEKPPVADNPVFKAYKEGTLVQKTETSKPSGKKLPPYPSREHFAGIWRVVSSPTGFPASESGSEASENLILRIDGTTAGGPILDAETNQKAAGGTWKMVEDANGDVLLRIRLVIPPKKERVLEMVGIISRMNMNSDYPMASKAFGIPYLEDKAKESNKGIEDLMYCGGDVTIEDAVTKKNKDQIGSFSLMKLQGPKGRGDYTITIPKPIRGQD